MGIPKNQVASENQIDEVVSKFVTFSLQLNLKHFFFIQLPLGLCNLSLVGTGFQRSTITISSPSIMTQQTSTAHCSQALLYQPLSTSRLEITG